MSAIMELDLKSLIRNQITVISTTVLKYNHILETANRGVTSSYILSQQELSALGTQSIQSSNLILSSRLEDVKCTPIIENDTISFALQIPIIDPQKEFSLFTITPVPSFSNSSTHIPVPDSNHIAINMQGDKYTTLNDLELTKCLAKPPECKSTKPISPIKDQTSCVASTYTSDTYKCQFKNLPNNTPPFVRFYDLNMIYSTKTEQRLFIKCYNPITPSSTQDDVILLKDMGLTTVKHSCDITLPDGTTHKTPRIPHKIDSSTQLFSEIKSFQHPSRTIIDISNRQTMNFDNFNDEQQPTNFQLSDILQPDQIISHSATVFITITVTFLLLLITYKCCPSIYTNMCNRCKRTPKLKGLPPSSLDIGAMRWFPDLDPNDEDPIIKTSTLPEQDKPQLRIQDPNLMTSMYTPRTLHSASGLPHNLHRDI